MSIRGLVILCLVLAALGLGWSQRQRLQAWLESAPLQASASPVPADASKAPTRFKAGELRKCVKGQQVSYSNVECPPGSQELAVTAAVNVVPATPVSKPDEASSGPSALHKALGVTRDDTLKDKMIERAVEKATR